MYNINNMKRVGKILLNIILSIILCTPASAISKKDLEFFAQNDIYFYDPTGTNTSNISVSSIYGATGILINYLAEKGNLTEIAVAGIYGNLSCEGFGGTQIALHEYGVNSIAKVGTYYNGEIITKENVKNLMDTSNMHGVGLAQWSFGRRVKLLDYLSKQNLDHYFTDWDDTDGRYIYDGLTYDSFAEKTSTEEATNLLQAQLDFLLSEDLTISKDDIEAQNLSKYGIKEGMNLYKALNLLETPEQAAELFFSTSEMPGWTSFTSGSSDIHASSRIANAKKGLEIIQSSQNKIVNTALLLAWEDDTHHFEVNPNFIKANNGKRSYCINRGKNWNNGVADQQLDNAQDCGIFVGTVIRYSEVDTNFPQGGTQNQYDYMLKSKLWTEIENNKNTNNLLPGDVFVYNSNTGESSGGHIFIYIGNGKIAHASLCNRTGNLTDLYPGSFVANYNGVDYLYHIFRFTGDNNE